MTDLSAWATEGKPGRPVGLGGGCAAQLRSEVWLEISISTIKTSWKAKHVSHRIVWQKGNMDPFHSFDMFDLMQMIVYCPIDRPEMGNLWG